MSDDDAKLSYEELVAILKQTTALEARRGAMTFSKQDLLDAAKQLGIDEKAATEVVEAHLKRRTSTDVAPRPFDTRINLEVTPDLLSLTVPPLRPSAKTLVPLGFTGFWFAFLTFWTWGASRGSTAFALFSVPFWLVGISLLRRSVLPLLQRTRLTLDRDAGELSISPLGKQRALRTSELRVSVGDAPRPRQSDDQARQQSAPAVLMEHGVETIALLDGYSPQEQKWIASELQAWLANV